MDDEKLRSTAVFCAKKLGFPTLRDKQLEVIVSSLRGEDVLAVLPTRYGKSLCYSCLPFAFDILEETSGYMVVVVSPLTAIMKDQVKINTHTHWERWTCELIF